MATDAENMDAQLGQCRGGRPAHPARASIHQGCRRLGRHGPCPRAHGGGMVRHWCRKPIVCDRGCRRSTTDYEQNRTRLRRKRLW